MNNATNDHGDAGRDNHIGVQRDVRGGVRVWRFQFRWALTIAVLIALIILMSLGNWQLQRRTWKLQLIDATASRIHDDPIPLATALARAAAGENMEYTPVRVAGRYRHDAEAPVAGLYDAGPGFYIFTPLETDDAPVQWGAGAVVYINRGFAPDAYAAPDERSTAQIGGPVIVDGLLRNAERPTGISSAVRPADAPGEGRWYTRDPMLMAPHFGLTTGPYYIDSFGREAPGPWPKGDTTRLDFNNRHMEYALTWFGLAGTLVGVFLVFSYRRPLADAPQGADNGF